MRENHPSGISHWRHRFLSDTALLLYLSLLKLVLHLTTAGQYGYFRDELYFLACSDHLDWGYVDQPSASIVVLAVVRWALGDSLIAIRLLAMVAGAVAVFFTGLIARRLGGGRYAQLTAAFAFIVAPVLLGQYRYFSMNAFDILAWTLTCYLIITIIQRNNPRLWLVFGLVIGLGLLNKYSIAFLCVGVLLGLLLTRHRSQVKSLWFWSGVLLSLLIVLPNLVWEGAHDFPTVEFLRNSQESVPAYAPIGFFFRQVGEIGRTGIVLLVLGVIYCFFDNSGKQFRVLGWTYVFVFCAMVIGRGKAYYLAPIFPVFLAAGSVFVEKLTGKFRAFWVRWLFLSLQIVFGVIDIPFAIPILPVDLFFRYQEFFGASPQHDDKEDGGLLRQNFADMFGWEEMVATVASSFHRLSPGEQSKCAILARNWGEAGAIDFFGKAYGLPKSICGHNSYWFWGPRDATGEVVLRVGGSADSLGKHYAEVIRTGEFRSNYCVPYENNLPIYICKGRRTSLREDWAEFKHFN